MSSWAKNCKGRYIVFVDTNVFLYSARTNGEVRQYNERHLIILPHLTNLIMRCITMVLKGKKKVPL